MYFTVKELLSADYMKEAKLIGGKAGMERHITQVTVIDSPDGIKFIRGKEFILTSSFALSVVEDKPSIIKELVNAGASCMAFKNKFIDTNTVEAMISVADELDFPLIEVPKEITWAEIISAFYYHLFSYQYKVIKYTEKVHTTFTEMVLNGDTVEDILKKLYLLIERPAMILNEFHDVIAAEGILSSDLFSQYDISQKIKQLKMLLATQKYCYTIINNCKLLVKLISTGINTYGFLLVFMDLHEDLDLLHLKAVEYATTVLTLEMVRQRQMEEMEKRLYGNFLNSIVVGKHQYDKNLLRKAKYLLGYHEGQEFCVVVLDIDNFADIVSKKELTEENIQNVKVKIERLIKAYFGNLRKKTFISIEDDNFIIFYPSPESNLFDLLDDLKNSILKHVPYLTFSIGVSQTYSKLEGIKKGFEESSVALDTGRKVWGKNKIYFYGNLGLYLLLVQDSSNNYLLQNYISNKYGNLLEYDRLKGGVLFKTLDAYFKANMNINTTARNLYLHPKTIKYRLEKIVEISGIDFKKQEDRLVLELITKLVLLDENSFIQER